jgi:hypothetical protein
LAELFPGREVRTLKRVIDPQKQCPDGPYHNFQQVYGGTGGQRCTKCEYAINAMSEEDHEEEYLKII